MKNEKRREGTKENSSKILAQISKSGRSSVKISVMGPFGVKLLKYAGVGCVGCGSFFRKTGGKNSGSPPKP